MFRRTRKGTSSETSDEVRVDHSASETWPPAVWTRLAGTSISCCCPAAPKVQVVMPPLAGRDPVALLLCGHHYHVSAQALRTAGAAVYNAAGMLLTRGEGQLDRLSSSARTSV